MDKRYQVFVSSTFTDLQDERQAVLRAVLEIDHMPAGMELFPATDDSAWQLIRDVIDASDYYVVIIGGRYGSLDEAGLGYTEKEYEYALETKKPVIPLLHENPDNLPREKTETDEAIWKKLQAFRKKVEKRHTCVYWKSADDLKAKVIVGLTTIMKRHPATGWVRADLVPSEATLAEILSLRRKITELESEAQAERVRPPRGTEDLKQGDDEFEVHFSFDARDSNYDTKSYKAQFSITWGQIFAEVAPSMIIEASEPSLRAAFRTLFSRIGKEMFENKKTLKDKDLRNFSFSAEDIDTCIVQFRAMGLIRESIRQRSLRDTHKYWSLTPYGDFLMTQLRALRRETLPPDGHQGSEVVEG